MNKEELLGLISSKESQLKRAKAESDCWNNGKYKNTSNAPISKIFVNSLQKEITSLRVQLSEHES